jgi:hypothetical protein
VTTNTRTFSDALSARIRASRASRAYRAYEEARTHVLRMKDAAARGGVFAPSAYWTEELENFGYMFDASPLVIERLRHHCFHLTGIRVYEYRSHRDREARQLEEKLRALQALGYPELMVPEPRDLGGFGFEIDNELFNIDTLKFFEALIAMQEGGVLAPLRKPAEERRVVLEIGAGWGGFGYQFKRLCPGVTYAIIDFPELFLFSATYLGAMFPEARLAFWHSNESSSNDEVLAADFLFIPHTALEELTLPRLDLTINMVSFQEMTSEQVDSYVRFAREQGAPYLYSLNRERSTYNRELTSVSEIIGNHYWTHEIPVLPVSYTQMLDKRAKLSSRTRRSKLPPRKGMPYRHLIGWRKRDE